MGFRHIVKEAFPNLEIVELREMRDDQETAFRGQAIAPPPSRSCRNLQYRAGNEGIARALKTYPSKGRVVYLAHELTAHNRARLLDGALDAVIDQKIPASKRARRSIY